MKTAELIKQHREKKNLTQKQVAEMLCYDKPQFLSLIENDHNKLPLYMAKTFCDVLGIKPSVMKKALLDDYSTRVELYMRHK